MKIVNVQTRKILTSKALSWDNEFIKGIRMSRYFASWIHCGGDINDRDGFIEWMMNIPFDDGHGGFTYISEDEAVDTYAIMKCGKSELERWAREYLAEHRQKKE